MMITLIIKLKSSIIIGIKSKLLRKTTLVSVIRRLIKYLSKKRVTLEVLILPLIFKKEIQLSVFRIEIVQDQSPEMENT